MINFITLLFLLSSNTAEGKLRKPLDIIISNYDYKFNTKFANGSVFLKPEGHICHATAGFVIYQDFISGILASFTLQIKLLNNVKKYQTLAQISNLDFCEFMKGSVKENMIKDAYNGLKKRFNMTLSCPIKANYYLINDLIVDGSKITALAMPGDYRLLISFDWKRKSGVNKLFDMAIEGGLKAK